MSTFPLNPGGNMQADTSRTDEVFRGASVAFSCPKCFAPIRLVLKLASDIRWPVRYTGACDGCHRPVELRMGESL